MNTVSALLEKWKPLPSACKLVFCAYNCVILSSEQGLTSRSYPFSTVDEYSPQRKVRQSILYLTWGDPFWRPCHAWLHIASSWKWIQAQAGQGAARWGVWGYRLPTLSCFASVSLCSYRFHSARVLGFPSFCIVLWCLLASQTFPSVPRVIQIWILNIDEKKKKTSRQETWLQE